MKYYKIIVQYFIILTEIIKKCTHTHTHTRARARAHTHTHTHIIK